MRIDPTPDLILGAVPAATVIMVRDNARGPEYLMIERAAAMGFAGGAMAFPGGKVDPGDVAVPADCFPGFDALAADDAAARIAAAREAFEETGVMLSGGGPVPALDRAMLRQRSDRHRIGFGALLDGVGHRLVAGRLRPFARWLPPAGLPIRFDTRFYVAGLPDGEIDLADGHEAVACRWARPADLLADAADAAISLLFPTRCILARLARFPDAATLMADRTPAHFVQPAVADGWISIPDGLGYPLTRERLHRVRRA